MRHLDRELPDRAGSAQHQHRLSGAQARDIDQWHERRCTGIADSRSLHRVDAVGQRQQVLVGDEHLRGEGTRGGRRGVALGVDPGAGRVAVGVEHDAHALAARDVGGFVAGRVKRPGGDEEVQRVQRRRDHGHEGGAGRPRRQHHRAQPRFTARSVDDRRQDPVAHVD